MSVKTVKNKPFIYGLTGGIASGKTSATNFFVSNNIKIFDSDQHVKKLWQENAEVIKVVKDKYQIDIKTIEGKKALSNIIFNNEEEKNFINSLIHPLVFSAIDIWLEEVKDEDFVIIDMPLLFESNYENKVDKTIVIYAKKCQQVKRLMKRNKLNKAVALLQINAQMSLKEKVKKADHIIKNILTLNYLHKQLRKLYEVMKNETKL